MRSGFSEPRTCLSQAAFMPVLRAAYCRPVDLVIVVVWFFQNVQVVESIPPTIPVPAAVIIARRPANDLGVVPSLYIALVMLLAIVVCAFSILPSSRLRMRSRPLFMASVGPSKVMLATALAGA